MEWSKSLFIPDMAIKVLFWEEKLLDNKEYFYEGLYLEMISASHVHIN